MKLGIFGYGGHAREVYWSLSLMERLGCKFFLDNKYYQHGENILPISEFDPNEYKMIVAVADPKFRQNIVESLPSETKYFTFIHPTAQILAPDVMIGEGSFIGVNCIITTNVTIGKHSILNRGNQIGHDTKIGDYFSAMPGAIVSGNVSIGDNCYMGTNSSVIEKLSVIDNVKIGANATVIENINEAGTYVGVPATKKFK